ncbi:hypothetical protein [Carboxylicivirga sp. RSCT41]|uniref:hypothetical protein n=1 Tax=Carboxylicivirga agarovorans TaxID=3417570 RepID=UPI003D342EBB
MNYTQTFKPKNVIELIYKYGNDIVPGFYLNDIDVKVYDRVYRYFFKDQYFESLQPSYRLNKGLLVLGNVGVGKSVMLQVFYDVLKHYNRLYSNIPKLKYFSSELDKATEHFQSFEIYKANDLSGLYSKSGYEIIEQHTVKSYMRQNGINNKDYPLSICYDDLGAEEQYSSHYGCKVNVLKEILLKRYDLFMAKNMRTIITTNLSSEQIQSYYGERVLSRLREMVNVVKYPGFDRRK